MTDRKARGAREDGLGFAVWKEDLGRVRDLLRAGASVDEYAEDSDIDVTPLMESVDELEPFYDATRQTLTRLLLDHDADVARRDVAGRTALHYAVGAGGQAVRLLLDAGANPDSQSAGGQTPLHEAISRASVSAVEALCIAGADRAVSDHAGRSPADLLEQDPGGLTSEELDVVRTLLQA